MSVIRDHKILHLSVLQGLMFCSRICPLTITANRLVNLTILLTHTKKNEFRKIVSGHRKFTENFVITLKEIRRKYHALRTYVAVCNFIPK